MDSDTREVQGALVRRGRGRLRARPPGLSRRRGALARGRASRVDVVDLGAGTGKLTRSLVALGHRVTAVEPLPEMIAHLRAAVPGVTAVEGGAEAIPLAAASADVVTARRRSTGSTTARRCARSRGCCGRAAGSRSSGTPATSASRGWRS